MPKLATKFKPELAAFAAGFEHAEFYLDATVLADWQNVAPARAYPDAA